MARIILTTIGSYGDLHPFMAISLALQAMGHQPVLAVPANHVEKCRAVGLTAEAAFPSYEALADQIGDPPDTIIRRAMESPDYLVREIMLRCLDGSSRRIDKLAEGAQLVVSSMFALAGPLVAQKRRLPLVPLILQPLGILSAEAPSLLPDLPLFARPHPGPLGQSWNRVLIRLMRAEMARRYGRELNRARRAHGLKASRSAPLFDVDGQVPVRLAVYDPAFAPLPGDAPEGTEITGFAHFDAATDGSSALSPELMAFLDAGPAPIVFTLGSFVVYSAGSFYAASLAAARRLGRRCVLLIGPEAEPPGDLGPDVLVADYAPHSQLFPRAACVVHHGGVGTTGQALLAGKPQLVVPFMGDQPDNAGRVAARGVGASLAAGRYTADRAAHLIGGLLADPAIASRAQTLSSGMIRDGAKRAATRLTGVIEGLQA